MAHLRTLLVTLTVFLVGCGGSTASPLATALITSSSTTAAPSAVVSTPNPTATPPYAPVARTSAAITWDPTSQAVVLFGGDSRFGATSEFDAWDGATWSKLVEIGPPSRDDGLLVADPERGVVVLAGGRNQQIVQDDTWEWDGTTWSEKDVVGPPPRAHAAAAYDHESKRMIVYGGVTETETMRDTWAWDGTAWTQLDDKGIPGLIPNGMAWDPILERLLVLAVDLEAESSDHTYPSELWGWTGDGWERVAKDGPSFSPLQQFVEGPRHPWLIDGGVAQGAFSTLEWTGTAWQPLDGPAPPLRNGQAVAFDQVRHQMVLFGGFVDDTVLGDSWLLDDGAWREVGA
jgi:hypothetical protein